MRFRESLKSKGKSLQLKLMRLLKKGDIILVSEKGLINSVSKLVQRSRWHHVMLYVGKGKVLEVTPNRGCDLTILDANTVKCRALQILRHKKVSVVQARHLIKTAIRVFKSKSFSRLQVLKIAFLRELNLLRHLLNLIVKRNRMKVSSLNVKEVICSNMVAMSYYLIGYRINESHPPDYVVPRDYANSRELQVVCSVVIA